MRFDTGTTDVPSAGTAVQISNTNDRVKAIEAHAPSGNTGSVYFGVSDVSGTGTINGRELAPGEAATYSFGAGSVLFSVFYVDAATSGDDLDWAVILD
jgi:hypothetical protein